MKSVVKLMIGASFLSLGACQVEKTQNGQMPNVDVNVSGGQLPEYNVQGPDVQVGTENKTIQVPTVDVKTPQDKKQDKK